MGIINVLKYIGYGFAGIAMLLAFFLIIYYIIWFIINVIEQIRDVE